MSLLISVDILSFSLSILVAYTIRVFLDVFFPNFFPNFTHPLSHYLQFHLLLFFVSILFLRGAYTRKNFFWEDVREYIIAGIFYGFLLFSFLSLSRQIYEFSRSLLVIHTLTLPAVSIGLRRLALTYFINKLFPTYVHYIGTEDSFHNFKRVFLKDPYLGFKCSDRERAEYIFISNTLQDYEELLREFQKKKRRVFVVEEKHDFPPMLYKLHLKVGDSLVGLEYENKLLDGINLGFKRLIDYAISVLLLPLILPLILVIALLIKLDSPGPVFYFHERVGRNGKKFKCIKFRTMYVNANEMLTEILKNPTFREEWEKYGKLREDPRVTRIGKFLRKTSLDEIPQIFNVLKGDMSLVGPRPVTEEELNKYYGEFKEYYLSVYPGITGLWQVSGRNKLSYRERVYLDVWYVLNWSPWLDIVILIKTVGEVVRPTGV